MLDFQIIYTALMLFSLGQVNTDYNSPFNYYISSSMDAPTCVFTSDTSSYGNLYVDMHIDVTANLSFDYSSSYSLHNFNISVSLKALYMDNDNHGTYGIYSTPVSYTLPDGGDITNYSVNLTYAEGESYFNVSIRNNGSSVASNSYYITDNLFAGCVSNVYLSFDANNINNLMKSVYWSNNSNIYQAGYDAGEDAGFENGRIYGFNEALDQDEQIFTIFNGILNVALIPINVFLSIFNFEVLGVNISALVSAMLSVAILVIVLRIVLGKKSDGD